MASKRVLKKCIDDLGSAIIEEMSVACFNIENADKDLIYSAISKVMNAIVTARHRTDATFGRKWREFGSTEEYLKAKRAFIKENYDKTISDFNESLGEALKEFNRALPEEVKEANKKAGE